MTEGKVVEPTEISPATLDPFAYFQGAASKIRGLGGSEQRPELAYGFHTHYIACKPGYRSISVKFDDLKATHGLIHLRVHMLSTRPGAQARVATVERVHLADLAAQGGEALIRFEALPNTLYAMFGQVLDTTDATAAGLTVVLDGMAGPQDHAVPEFEPTMFGRETTRGSGLLTSDEEPSLAAPVSQVMSVAQLREPAFSRWQAYLAVEGDTESAWQQTFVLRALDEYGLLDRGADGLGYADLGSGVSAVLARRQCVVTVAIDEHQEITEMLDQKVLLKRIPTICDTDLDELTPFLHVVSREEEEALQTPFDFVWSLNILGLSPDFASAMTFVQHTITRLRPGGVGVHVTRIALDETGSPAGYLTRSQVERIALNLISQGHTVAQIRFRLGDRPRLGKTFGSALTPFGLIVRRG